jgi:hypothetical protein
MHLKQNTNPDGMHAGVSISDEQSGQVDGVMFSVVVVVEVFVAVIDALLFLASVLAVGGGGMGRDTLMVDSC